MAVDLFDVPAIKRTRTYCLLAGSRGALLERLITIILVPIILGLSIWGLKTLVDIKSDVSSAITAQGFIREDVNNLNQLHGLDSEHYLRGH